MFCDSVRRFAERNLTDGALTRAHLPGFPWDVAKLAAAQGLLGLTIPQQDGGQGGTLMDAVLAVEQIALVCPRSADVLQAGNFGPIRVLAAHGSDQQKQRYLPDLLAGKKLIAVAMTEPEAGSAVTDLATTATADGDGFRVSGSKVFTSHSPDATLFLTYVRFGPGTDGIGSVLIERDCPGLTFGQPTQFMAGDYWRQLYFDDCRIGADQVLLGKGGFKKQISTFNVERIGNAARSLAVGRHAFNIAREYAATRMQFGRTLNEFQGLQWSFAELAMQMEAAQLLLYRAAVNAQAGHPSAYETAIAKAYCNQTGFALADGALQAMGGLGYTETTLVDYCFRRTRGWKLAGGSIEIMKNRIAEGIFERRFSQRPGSTGD